MSLIIFAVLTLMVLLAAIITVSMLVTCIYMCVRTFMYGMFVELLKCATTQLFYSYIIISIISVIVSSVIRSIIVLMLTRD